MWGTPRRFEPPQPLLRVVTVNNVVVRSVDVVVGVVDVGVVIVVVETVPRPQMSLVIGKMCNRPFKSKTVKSGIMCVVLVASPFNGIQIEQPISATLAPCIGVVGVGLILIFGCWRNFNVCVREIC